MTDLQKAREAYEHHYDISCTPEPDAAREYIDALESGLTAAVLAEREACAQVCERTPNLSHPSDFSEAIRARTDPQNAKSPSQQRPGQSL